MSQCGVNIVHTYRGDLTVDLVGPNGTVYSLLTVSGDNTDDVDQTFTVNASAQPVNGTWKLRVQDRSAIDTGYIRNWQMTFVLSDQGAPVRFSVP